MQHFRGFWLLLIFSACANRPQHDASRATIASLEELACIDSPAPRAEHRAVQPAAHAGPGTVVIQLIPLDSLRRNVDAQFQLWGGGGGAGGGLDSLGSATLSDRQPGPYRLAVRAAASQPRAWSYVVTVRPGLVDTIRINLAEQCTQIAK